jgi:hypothetical protein
LSSREAIRALAVLVFCFIGGWCCAQTADGNSVASSSSGVWPQANLVAQDGQNSQNVPFQPIEDYDEPRPAPIIPESRSFLLPGAQFSQAVDTNEGEAVNTLHGVTRALGSLSLEKISHRYDTALDYVGGVAYYANHPASLQLLDGDEHITWKTGKFAIRDAFSYLPEGNFGAGSFGGAGALGGIGGGLLGLSGLGILGPGQFASLGQEPRLTNVAITGVTQYLSARASVSGVGSYGFVHFTDNTLGLIDSHQFVAQASYNYQLSRKNLIAVLYAYQAFRFPSVVGNDTNANLVNFVFRRRINGRMEFLGGAGPEFTHVSTPLFILGTPTSIRIATDQVTISGRASLRYEVRNSRLTLSYFRYDTNGSGFFAGAITDRVRFSWFRPISRVWTLTADVGYSHNQRLAFPTDPSEAKTFTYVYAGAAVRRKLSRELTGFVSYQFTNLSSDQPLCAIPADCRLNQREVALIGLDWHPRPIPLE